MNENQQVFAGKVEAIFEGIEAFLNRIEEERGLLGAGNGSGDDFEGEEEKIEIPKFINYQIKSKIIGLSTEYSNFQPVGQTKLYD